MNAPCTSPARCRNRTENLSALHRQAVMEGPLHDGPVVDGNNLAGVDLVEQREEGGADADLAVGNLTAASRHGGRCLEAAILVKEVVKGGENGAGQPATARK